MLDRWVSFATWLMLAASVTGAIAIFVQIRFVGFDPGWRPAPAAAPASPELSRCEGGAAVRNAAGNPGLVADCAALLQAKDELAGAGALNWRPDLAIALWDGVVVGRASGARRVQGLLLEDRGLAGAIPAALGRMPELRELRLAGNRLTGCVPAGLRGMAHSDLSAFGLAYCTCADGAAVPYPAANPGLVSDCRILLRAKDALRGDADLDWSVDLPIADWEGVGLADGAFGRVASIHLRNKGLTGRIPAGLGGLTELTHLHLGANNYLDGPIPAELGNLTRLREFYAGGGNRLTGELPAELGNLTELRVLYLTGNRLSGSIPDLSGLTRLEYLNLRGNRLTGRIPSWLGAAANLQRLNLRYNRLTGGITTGLANLSRLQELYLAHNPLTGCVPAALRGVERNDLSDLGLPDCPAR